MGSTDFCGKETGIKETGKETGIKEKSLGKTSHRKFFQSQQ